MHSEDSEKGLRHCHSTCDSTPWPRRPSHGHLFSLTSGSHKAQIQVPASLTPPTAPLTGLRAVSQTPCVLGGAQGIILLMLQEWVVVQASFTLTTAEKPRPAELSPERMGGI